MDPEAVTGVAEKAQEWITLYGIKVVAAIAIFIVGRWITMRLKKLIVKLMEKRSLDPSLVSFVASLTYIGLMTFIIIAVLSQLGVETTSFIAVLGAAGLAVGLALQGSLANFAAGVLIIIFKPFKVGDFIEAGGAKGVVEEMEIFTTQLKSPDNKKIIIPNAKLTGDNIVNYTAKEQRRVDLVIGVAYDSDLAKTKDVLTKVLTEDARILDDPAPTVGVVDLADSSVNFVVRPWVKTAEYWAVYFDTMQKIKERLDEEGIGIPFPQRDVHLYQEEKA